MPQRPVITDLTQTHTDAQLCSVLVQRDVSSCLDKSLIQLLLGPTWSDAHFHLGIQKRMRGHCVGYTHSISPVLTFSVDEAHVPLTNEVIRHHSESDAGRIRVWGNHRMSSQGLGEYGCDVLGPFGVGTGARGEGMTGVVAWGKAGSSRAPRRHFVTGRQTGLTGCCYTPSLPPTIKVKAVGMSHQKPLRLLPFLSDLVIGFPPMREVHDGVSGQEAAALHLTSSFMICVFYKCSVCVGLEGPAR